MKPFKQLFLAFLFPIVGTGVFAQTETDSILKVIENNDIKLSALPYYSYGKGLGLTSADSLF